MPGLPLLRGVHAVCIQYTYLEQKKIRKKRSVAVIRPRSLKHLVDVTGMRALRKGFISSKLYSLASSFLSRQIIFLRTFYFAAYLFSVSPNYLVGRVTGIFCSRPVLSFIRIYFGGDVFVVIFFWMISKLSIRVWVLRLLTCSRMKINRRLAELITLGPVNYNQVNLLKNKPIFSFAYTSFSH